MISTPAHRRPGVQDGREIRQQITELLSRDYANVRLRIGRGQQPYTDLEISKRNGLINDYIRSVYQSNGITDPLSVSLLESSSKGLSRVYNYATPPRIAFKRQETTNMTRRDLANSIYIEPLDEPLERPQEDQSIININFSQSKTFDPYFSPLGPHKSSQQFIKIEEFQVGSDIRETFMQPRQQSGMEPEEPSLKGRTKSKIQLTLKSRSSCQQKKCCSAAQDILKIDSIIGNWKLTESKRSIQHDHSRL